MKDKKEKRKKLENRRFLAIFVLVLSSTLLLITWVLFLVLSFVKILAKISPFKRKIRKGKNKPNKNE